MSSGALHIVGAGPVGSMLACLLEQAGRDIHVWETRTSFPDCSMAIGITPPSLDLLDRIHLGDTFRQEGVLIPEARVYENGTEVGRLDFGSPPSSILSLPQMRTVQLLREAFQRIPHLQFHEGHSFPGLDSVPSADVVIACDGAKSTLRDQAGISFSPKPYPVRFVMADYPDHERWGPPARLYFSNSGALESFPLPETKRRWIAQLPPGTPPTHALLHERVYQACGVELSTRTHTDLWPFTPQWGLAETYHRENLILCGDAAHVMSPIGGQGMNTGFADASHLAQILPDPSPEQLAAYTTSRSQAFRISARRAAWGMYLGSRTGNTWSGIRRRLVSGMLQYPASASFLVRTFSMRNLPAPVFT